MKAQQSTDQTLIWTVTRHNGRGEGINNALISHQQVANGEAVANIRVLYSGPSESLARRHFDNIATRLRQGAVYLFHPDGRPPEHTSAPRLRTRW